MKITNIEQQRRVKSRYNLYLDNEFALAINQDLLIDLNLFVGKIISRSELDEICDAEEYQKALIKAFDLISRRMQSEKELRKKMWGKFTRNNVDKVIARLKDLGYVDDLIFTKLWFQNRLRDRGLKLVLLELKQKGIEKNIIDLVLTELNTDKNEIIETARRLLNKKIKPGMSKDEKYKKIGGYLARKGFDYETIKIVINESEA